MLLESGIRNSESGIRNPESILGGISRPMLRLPEALNLAPTGARLWATWLDLTPGFNGRIDYIHKCNIPSLFTFDFGAVTPEYRGHRWYPSRLEVEYSLTDIDIHETKFVSWDDVAVSVLSLPAEIQVSVSSSVNGRRLELRSGAAWFAAEFRHPAPGVVVAACAIADDEETARSHACDWADDPNPTDRHRQEYLAWFDGTPSFRCGDPLIEKMWAYRWFLVRRNLADPRRGNLQSPLFYEGRALKMSDDPYDPHGWEFSKLINFCTPFHLLESRWHADPSPAYGEVMNLARTPGENGLLQSLFVDHPSFILIHFIAWAAWELYKVHPNMDWLREVAPALAADLRGWLQVYDPDGDGLPEIDLNGITGTGKEFQPSFWWTPDGFATDPRNPANPIMERVDAASYLYMNSVALAAIYAELGDEMQSQDFSRIATRIRDAVLRLMWDPEVRFFCDLTPDHTRAPVRNVVGFDPFMAGIAGDEHLAVFEYLDDPSAFATEFPIPSVTKDCPLYAPDASFSGVHIKGPHGCVWNGPTWPFTNSTVLMSVAQVSRRLDHRFDALFADLLEKYTKLMFLDGDFQRPDVVEHYNPETGASISQEEDYFHSSWIDLIVTGVVGLQVERNSVTVDPLDCGLSYFDLDNVLVRGRRLRITWRDREREAPDDLEPGLRIWIDGKLILESERLSRFELPGFEEGR